MAIDRNERFDVIVVGAGPAGAAAALRLAEQRVKVLVIRARDDARCEEYDGRPYLYAFSREIGTGF